MRPDHSLRPSAFGQHAGLLLALSLLCAPVSAQQMYRCGNTYSQTPCGPDGAALRTPADVPADRPAAAQAGAVCTNEAPRLLNVPDPTQLRVLSVNAVRAEVIQYAGQAVAARRYDLNISMASPAGVWLPARAYSCYLSEDQQRLLKFETRRP